MRSGHHRSVISESRVVRRHYSATILQAKVSFVTGMSQTNSPAIVAYLHLHGLIFVTSIGRINQLATLLAGNEVAAGRRTPYDLLHVRADRNTQSLCS